MHELLSRIRWDPAFAAGRFTLAYADHRRREPVEVPFSSVIFDAGSSRMIRILDPDGESRKVPLHRIRRVCRDGTVIWQRPDPSPRESEP